MSALTEDSAQEPDEKFEKSVTRTAANPQAILGRVTALAHVDLDDLVARVARIERIMENHQIK